jgi:diaminohydroxyphosphoribosylaminopyrimidine deaminase/5-amino-6-(5-phosphoribosylamino)uracil reductase
VHSHFDYMILALQLAAQGKASVSPNPMVGCVIVRDSVIVGQGFHQRAGEAHAEIFALNAAGIQAKGATAYITLEPCCHYGKTPPCVTALLHSGIKKVYVAALDPNPLVAGKGIQQLEAAGVEVEVGLCATEAKELNEIFFHFMQHQRPFVVAKWAMSLDGKTITHLADSKIISGQESQQHMHGIRSEMDAILIGAGTARSDDPLLTARLHVKNSAKQPLRIILTSKAELSAELRLFNPDLPGKTLIAATEKITNKFPEHIEILSIRNLLELLSELGRRNITSLLVEGGVNVREAFFADNLVNRIQVYLAPVIIGSLTKKMQLPALECSTLGSDVSLSTNLEEL